MSDPNTFVRTGSLADPMVSPWGLFGDFIPGGTREELVKSNHAEGRQAGKSRQVGESRHSLARWGEHEHCRGTGGSFTSDWLVLLLVVFLLLV